jgi:hypothetical protein
MIGGDHTERNLSRPASRSVLVSSGSSSARAGEHD